MDALHQRVRRMQPVCGGRREQQNNSALEGGIVSEILVARTTSRHSSRSQLDVFKAELDIMDRAHLVHVEVEVRARRAGVRRVLRRPHAYSGRESTERQGKRGSAFGRAKSRSVGEVSMLRRALQLSTQSEGIREVLEAKTKVRKSRRGNWSYLVVTDGYKRIEC